MTDIVVETVHGIRHYVSVRTPRHAHQSGASNGGDRAAKSAASMAVFQESDREQAADAW